MDTNKAYKTFLDATGWTPPVDDTNWLAHWENGTVPEGADNQPVRWVSHGDAEAYCAAAGKRLPHRAAPGLGGGHKGRPWHPGAGAAFSQGRGAPP